MTKLEKIAKNQITGPMLPHFTQIWPLQFFLWVFSLLYVRHHRKLSLYAISRKTYDPNSRKWRKFLFSVWFSPPWPKFRLRNVFFSKQYLDNVPSYYPMQFKGKIINQTWENRQKPNFGLDFCPFYPDLGFSNFFVGFTFTRCKALLKALIVCNCKEKYDPNSRKWRETWFLTWSESVQSHLNCLYFLTLSWRTSLSYRNQSIDLLRKTMDWFLYENNGLVSIW